MTLLSFEAVCKSYPGVVALDGVSFTLAGGEVRALMGENGAGKSTLLKILGGDQQADAGRVRVDGAAVDLKSPRQSAAAGIAIIHQELHLAPNLSVAENLLLGIMPTRSGILDRRALREKAQSVLFELDEDISPDALVGDLAIGKRQMVEIGKALLRKARIIAFDEPTSSLSTRETRSLMTIIDTLRRKGVAILYVSHRMEEVFEISDTITVLRDGRRVADFARSNGFDENTVISAMAGRPIGEVYGYCARAVGAAALSVDGLDGPGLRHPVSFMARAGEILGFFGLVGAGRTELFRLLYGARPATSGTIRVHGAELKLAGPASAIRAGIALCPEDRKDEGIIPRGSVTENIVLARRNICGQLLVDRASEAQTSEKLIALMRVKTASIGAPIATLSGGNQQKAIIARWLAADSQIFLMDEPTRGIDVAARSEIYARMYELAERGKTILFASSDMPEVMGVADRIIVMCEGRIAGLVSRDDATPETLLQLAFPDTPAGLVGS